MWKLVIFCLFAIIYPADAASSKWVTAGEAKREDVISLHPITPTQALPFIFFASTESKKVQRAFGLKYAEINNGRLASGTLFFTIPDASHSQMFFCQNPDSTKVCLVPKNFATAAPLECPESEEPTPVLQPRFQKLYCGVDNSGVVLMFNYHICPAKLPYIYESENFRIYSFCYNINAKKILFASYSIMMAVLLKEDLLIWERGTKFTMNTESYELIDKGYYYNLQYQIQKYRAYDLQTLVPPEDMPLATFKKVTHYHANFALQHKQFVEHWNNIRSHIRNQAIRLNNQDYFIMTGVFDIPKNEIHIKLDRKQLASIWVTQIITQDRQAGLAILMNNFVTNASTSKGNDENSQQKYIDKLCHNENSCVLSLKESFQYVRGEVRCCKITQTITNLFSPDTLFAPSTLLHILKITY